MKAVDHIIAAIGFCSQLEKTQANLMALQELRLAVEKLQSVDGVVSEGSIPDECPHMIVFEDADRAPITFSGAGAKDAAAKAFEMFSTNWNAHLFVRFKCNFKDDFFYPSLIAKKG